MRKFYFIVMAFLAMTSNAQVIQFPDAMLKAKLLSLSALDSNGNPIYIDSNNNGEIEVSETAAVYTLYLQSANISNMSGIENFTNLRKLFCRDNNLTNLNVQSLVNLQELECEYNQLTTLQVSGLASLKRLNFGNNNLQTVDLSGLNNLEYLQINYNPLQGLTLTQLTNLKTFKCLFTTLSSINLSGLGNLISISTLYNSSLTSLNVSGCYSLIDLHCYYNALQVLSVNGCYSLRDIDCGANNLTTVDFSDLINLEQLSCYSNNFVYLDMSLQPNFDQLICYNNDLISINLKNGSSEQNLNLLSNPTLRYICVDESETTSLLNYLTLNLITGCEVNSYCTFAPGGNYFTVNGNITLDADNNGCDANDHPFPSMLFHLTHTATAIQSGYISDGSGSYNLPMRAGSYTLTPIFENPEYFNISPSTINIDFPSQASPLAQHFCVTPNGNHSDLEILVLPMVPARPGFDAKYKIVYKNKGNQIQSGSAYFAFNDAVADFVAASPMYSAQAMNYLVWHFTNLQPFESREILVILHTNSPVQIPAVNSGFVLQFTASINGGMNEGTPNDNVFGMAQVVVNSFDPNDKTCLQGNVISPEMIGKDVHYMIRFENTGTANAENIVVKDLIDINKFDITSLVPLSSSHPFETKITHPNKVEFVFENINLPFDDANNDGYVAFKIKTLPTLLEGTTLSNSASIYFDYNFPIVTEPAITAIGVLGTKDFDFASYFRIYPNPVDDVLQLETLQNIELTCINIYNTLGQLVLAIPNANETKSIDVSQLQTGSYFIKINSDNGITTSKFIKK